jgi:hypothetical protein
MRSDDIHGHAGCHTTILRAVAQPCLVPGALSTDFLRSTPPNGLRSKNSVWSETQQNRKPLDPDFRGQRQPRWLRPLTAHHAHPLTGFSRLRAGQRSRAVQFSWRQRGEHGSGLQVQG